MEHPQRLACAALLLVVFAVPSLRAQDGSVPSSIPGSPAAPVAADPKALPWKFLAGPADTVLSPDKEATIREFGQQDKWDCNKIRKCAVERFIQDALKISLEKAKAKYVVIHVADYGVDGNKTPDAWYLYRTMDGNWGDPKWDFSKFMGQRIYGASSTLFLFVHLHAKAISLAEVQTKVMAALAAAKTARDAAAKNTAAKDTAAKDTAAKDTAAKDTAAKDTAAKDDASSDPRKSLEKSLGDMKLNPDLAADLLQVPDLSDEQIKRAVKAGALTFPAKAGSITIPIVEKGSGDHFQWFGDEGVPSSYANVHYEAAVVKRTPANVEDFINVLKILGKATASTRGIEIDTTSTVIVWGAGQIDKIGLPSDVSIAGYNKRAGDPMKDEDRPTFQIGAVGAFNDEQLYWWDASIGIPVHKIKDLQYSSSDNTVVASQVDRQSAYAMFNLMLHPVDLSNPRDNIWPRLLVGFPITSSPWDKLFAGGAIGLPFKPLRNFQFFAGATFNRTKRPATLAAGSTATAAELQNDLRIQTTPKFTFGINVPVKSVLSKLLP